MKAGQQIPRNALVWIIVTQFSLVALHTQRIPIWLLAVYIFAAVWRIQVYAGRWSFPGRPVKIGLILTAFAGIYFSFGSIIGLEPTVALLLAAFALKLIELARRKDAYVLLFLAYFVCVTEFLFTQHLLIVLYSIFNVVLITTALIALHQPGEDRFNFRTIRLALVMLAQSIPLMLVLFFLFPRIGPLWTVPIKSHTAKTGVSDFLRPGDISNLSQSDDVAFRAQFTGPIPDKSELYWRGLVMSRLSDGAWSSLQYYDVPVEHRRPVVPQLSGEPVEYSIIMEPTQQNWLYGLRYAGAGEAKVMATNDYRIFSPVILEDQYRYSVQSWPETVLEPELSAWRRITELALPPNNNPQTLEFARALRKGSASDRDFVDAVLQKFNAEPYVYTLQPPLLGEHAMDEFLFQTRRGFCEHYAYAFTVMMRAAGIPARIVAGYQGGEINPVNSTVIVHQFDAHAWAEIWLEGEGWIRVDPTAAVSPDRIEWGLERAMSQEGSFLANSPLSPLRYRSVVWLNAIRLRYDALTWRWQSWVVAYDTQQQYEFLADLMGAFDARKFALILLGTGALVLIPVGFSLMGRRTTRRQNPADKYYRTFCTRLAKQGMSRNIGEPPGAFAIRAIKRIPAAALEIREITDLYVDLAYADESLEGERSMSALRELERAVKRFRVSIHPA
jgi:transglutaminase-like putative cysteine protease